MEFPYSALQIEYLSKGEDANPVEYMVGRYMTTIEAKTEHTAGNTTVGAENFCQQVVVEAKKTIQAAGKVNHGIVRDAVTEAINALAAKLDDELSNKTTIKPD